MGFRKTGLIAFRAASLLTIATACLWAQAPADDSLPGVDLTGLTAPQKASVRKLLVDQGCSCGCGMTVADCRVKDPACTYSTGLAKVMVETIKKGGTEADAVKAAASSQYAHVPSETNRLLENPIELPTSGAPVLGSKTARITLVEFSDFQCPYCVAAVPQLKAVMKAFPTQVKLIFKQYPLENHSQAAFAATAALAAHQQGKFWAMHDALFAHHNDLSKTYIFSVATSLGIDMQKFEADLKSPTLQKTLETDIADGDRAGVPGTPTLFIDGQRFNGPITLEVLKPVLEKELKQGPETKTVAALPKASGTR
jgi:protein-disulfide isomerase